MKNADIDQKRAHLVRILEKQVSLVVAFSGGLDSTYLLSMALAVLGNSVIAVTADAPIFPSREKSAAVDLSELFGVRHIVMPFRVLDVPEFLANKRNRCYVCKKSLFGDMLKIAENEGIEAVAHGENLDDLEDFRPGFAAARGLGQELCPRQ